MATVEKKRINHPRQCCICFEDLAGHVVQTDCGHVYHFHCLQRWLTNSDTEGSSSNGGPPGVEIVEDMTEDEQLAHIIDLTRDAIRPINNVCPMCKKVVNQEKNINYVDYENQFAKMDTEGLTEDEKKAVGKRKRANEKRAERRKRNKVYTRNTE